MKPDRAKGIAAPGGQVAAKSEAQKTTRPDLNPSDPLLGWYALAAGVKQSKLRQHKRGWQRKGGK